MKRLSVKLVYHPGKADPDVQRMRLRGSDAMRGPQLAALVAPHLPDHIEVRAVALPLDEVVRKVWTRNLARHVVILLKNAVRMLAPEETFAIARQCLALGQDPIDADLEK